MVILEAPLISAEPALRESLQPLFKKALPHRYPVLRSGPLTSPAASQRAHPAVAGSRWQDLDAKISNRQKLLADLPIALVPQLVDAFGVGPDTDAELGRHGQHPLAVGQQPRRDRAPHPFAPSTAHSRSGH